MQKYASLRILKVLIATKTVPSGLKTGKKKTVWMMVENSTSSTKTTEQTPKIASVSLP